MRRIALVTCLLAFAAFTLGAATERPAVFQLFAVVPDADFDAAAIAGIDGLKIPYPKGSSFHIGEIPTKKGKFTLLKFVMAFWGETSDGTRLVHDLLVLKLDGKKVVDGYLYTLEWQDSPSVRLARMTAKNVEMKAGMRLAVLGMKRKNGDLVGGDELLDNVFDGKKVF